MALEQDCKFKLNLELSESYIMEQRLHRIIHIQLIFSKQVILLLFFRQILLISESHAKH